MFFLGVICGVGGVFLLAYISAKSQEKKKQAEEAKKQAESETLETVEESGMNEDKGVENNG